MSFPPRSFLIPTAVLAGLMLWELARPKRPLSAPRFFRWLNNLGLSSLNAVLLAFLSASASLTLVEAAKRLEVRRIGLLNLTAWPYPVKFVLAFVLLDLAIYAQHWTFHAVPWLWRAHKVHHTDVDLDATTGVRFHPAELFLSFFVKAAAVAVIGAYFLVVAVFELALTSASLFSHADIRLPERLDAWLRLAVVTPDMHRVHHSVASSETNSNFGFCLPWWDRLLGTYEGAPASGPILMALGLPEYRDWRAQSLPWLLLLPFR
ncbi:MAG: sterol desaturase family protein [Elusimicrobia bacterium]|nr:sterol desaturase family protein [Elusimicrobiota bacterium]